jgi:hypothetical protein
MRGTLVGGCGGPPLWVAEGAEMFLTGVDCDGTDTGS